MMLTFTIVLIVLALLAEFLSLKDTLILLNYATHPTKPLVDPGEEFEVVSVFENPRRLPLPFIDVRETLPPDITVNLTRGHTHYTREKNYLIDDGTMRLRSTVYLWPRQRLERRIPASLAKRGRYLLRGAFVQRGDFFGLRQTYRDFSCHSEIIVIPARASDDPALAALGDFLGDISVRRFTMEDPVLTLGFDEYTGREPLRDISWVQSARLGRMMVKKYDYTLEPAVTVLLNVDCNNDDQKPELLERCFSLTRTVCESLEEQRIKYRVNANAVVEGLGALWPVSTDGLGISHLTGVLESLGRATYDCAEKFDRTIERAICSAEHGRSHIIITPYENNELKPGLNRLKMLTGGEIAVISARLQEVI